MNKQMLRCLVKIIDCIIRYLLATRCREKDLESQYSIFKRVFAKELNAK